MRSRQALPSSPVRPMGGSLRRRVPALVALAVLAACAPVANAPADPPGSFAFAALGDGPYYWYERGRYRSVLDEISSEPLAFVVHVGDIFWRPCSDAMYRQVEAELNALPHPVIYVPGDNEWTDCWRRQPGGYDPLGRLARIREIFFADPTTSLGGRPIALRSQAGAPDFGEFVEHATWDHRQVTFATLHLVGSSNGLDHFSARTPASDLEAARRTAAAVAWLRETFRSATVAGSTMVVLATHADLGLERPPDDPHRHPFDVFLRALEQAVASFAGTVALIHGDFHEFTVDRPLVHRDSGRRLDNFTRIQVPGSPDIGWTRIVVTPALAAPERVEAGSAAALSVEARIRSRWQIW